MQKVTNLGTELDAAEDLLKLDGLDSGLVNEMFFMEQCVQRILKRFSRILESPLVNLLSQKGTVL